MTLFPSTYPDFLFFFLKHTNNFCRKALSRPRLGAAQRNAGCSSPIRMRPWSISVRDPRAVSGSSPGSMRDLHSWSISPPLDQPRHSEPNRELPPIVDFKSYFGREKKKKRKKSQIPFFICFLSFGYTLLPDFPRKARELKPQCLFQMEPDILKQEPPGALPRKTIAFPLPPTLLILGASSELH